MTGIDLSRDFIAEARRRAAAATLQAEFREGSAEALPFAGPTFDIVRVKLRPRNGCCSATAAAMPRPQETPTASSEKAAVTRNDLSSPAPMLELKSSETA